MLIPLLLLESTALCFILLLYCVVGIANGAGKFTVFYEKDVQNRAIELGYTTKAKIRMQTVISILVLYLPCFTLVPFMVCFINGAATFGDIFLQSLVILYILGLFDRFFIDWYWVERTKAWLIPETEDLMPYISKKMKVVKWLSTIAGFALIAFIIAIMMSNVIYSA